MTYDGAAVNLYVDGATIGAALVGSSSSRSTGVTVGPYPGAYDELAIYDRALSAAEVQEHFALAP